MHIINVTRMNHTFVKVNLINKGLLDVDKDQKTNVYYDKKEKNIIIDSSTDIRIVCNMLQAALDTLRFHVHANEFKDNESE